MARYSLFRAHYLQLLPVSMPGALEGSGELRWEELRSSAFPVPFPNSRTSCLRPGKSRKRTEV